MFRSIVYAFLCVILLASCHQGNQSEASLENQDKQLSEALEVVGIPTSFALDSLLEAWGISGNEAVGAYQWKNHLVFYGELDEDLLQKKVTASFPEVKIKQYNSPMYVFDRATHCADKELADEWRHYLLTANLVKDSTMQQEYMDYHATQFDEWPEVAQGFCKAAFQQLLVFRNGRQLLLVISIPEGKTLDELNPKTVENNPRVVAWNQLMSQYQEGLPETAPEEVWVFLEPVGR